ncbi:U3 small nucleolar RNA-associated protein 25 homolog [Uloborus diversus]|uniref:U3 small nucleolar RNA-associated protein 25 homolog n=1 Tax=Uloborus diversus TaxID=327109 RepID=UPI00240A2555|nr:U3 small nucleolar RNA-associated protein 25 homolog [Uloborus diversus]
MESSDEVETPLKCKKRLLSIDENPDGPENKKIVNDKKISDEEEEEALPANDPYTNHFKCELPEISATGKLKFDSKKFDWENIGTFIHSKPQISVSESKEPSIGKKIETFALKKNLYSAFQNIPLFDLEKSPDELSLFNLILSYFDVLYMKRTYQNGENLRLLYILHVLNHVLKTSAKIIHHNSKLAKNPDEEYRDQGFTRTTCIILVPFRHDVHRIVSQLTSLLPNADVRNRKRFEDEYGSPPKSERMKKKPQDYDETFEGNTNEDFKIGLCIKNKSITLYSEFYKSDLIIASPLGLRQVIGAEGEKDRDFDFLSSVEILVIDRADVLFLQNSLHLLHVLKHMNLLPKESHGCNFFRVKMYALNGMAKFYRQTILLSSVENTWFETFIFQNQCFNYSGYLSSVTKVKSPAIQQVLEPMKMCFRWFETSTLENEIDDRFNFFITKVLPDFKDNAMAQTLVYIPSYFDFVRLRNHFREMELSCVMICEYSKKGKIAQARDVFFKGYRHFMLYTERAHFYSRYHIKGIQHIIFYQLPLYPSFFHELCNALMDSNPRRKFEEKSCTVLSSKFELLQMKHIVGLAETKHMYNSKKKIFVKYTEK